MKMKHKFLNNEIPPDTEILVVGTFNPEIPGNAANFFYSRGQNVFWELMSAIFEEKCVRYESKNEKKAFIKRHKIAFADLIEEINLDEKEASTYSDRFLDKHLNTATCKDIAGEIARLKHLKKVCFTRSSFGGIPNIKKKIDEIAAQCKNKEHPKRFACLPTPANCRRIDPQKRFAVWKEFFTSWEEK